MLHGGPGIPHDRLEPLKALIKTGRPVVFYDQLGCGNSDKPDNSSIWSVELFLDELATVRRSLGLDRIHLFGHSWGGMLAMEYALTQPDGILSLTLASSPASIPLWITETKRLREELPPEVQETLLLHEADGTTDNPAYSETMMIYYHRHVCRLSPWPKFVKRGVEKKGKQVYETMLGPNETDVIGRLKNWDITSRLGSIRIPSLLTSGRYDEFTPTQAAVVRDGIPDCTWVLFEKSSHMPHAEETEHYLEVLNDFLTRIEGLVKT
jgi:proline-specific peptidase